MNVFRDRQLSQALRHRLNELLNGEFSSLVKEDHRTDAIVLTFNIPGKQGTSHYFEWPTNGFLTNKNANKICNFIKQKDPNLSDCISFTYYSQIVEVL